MIVEAGFMEGFHPLTVDWFRRRYGRPTDPQRLGWPEIQAGKNTLIAAPTGSGKTLSAFLACIDRMFRQGLEGDLPNETQVLYISPLKALSNDIRKNLEIPLAELRLEAESHGLELPELRVAVRTGDTPASQRQSMLKRPPHLLVTTPESVYLLLTSEKGRELLRTVRTVIVDEIHALARDKRGSHFALSMERLEALCAKPPVRIGLSATQRPMDEIARFLVGSRRVDQSGKPDCQIIDVGHARRLDLAVETPASELGAVCSNEQWAEVYERICSLIESHTSTLIFVNTRRMAERMSHSLRERLGEDAVAGHHGSMAREIRLSVEDRLKEGKLKAIVATASLELGIDIGAVDLVCQISSPRAIATFLQRVGRAGHSLGAVPKGRLFPLTRDDMVEALSLVRAVRSGRLDAIEIPQKPLDILAQQIAAAVAVEEWGEEELYSLCRRAWPYRDLSRDDFDDVLAMLSENTSKRPSGAVHLHRDRINGRLRTSRGARITALTCGGAIPDTADYRVVTEGERTFIGTVNEDFAIDSSAGDVFLLGNSSWRIRHVRGGEVVVNDAEGMPATVPFWLGEAPGRTFELSAEISDLREQLEQRVDLQAEDETRRLAAAIEFLQAECLANPWAAEQTARYIAAQKAAIGLVPTQRRVVFERFFDETGGMQLVLHTPFGSRVNRAWGLAMRKRFCRSFDFELQAAADNNGVVLSLGPQHSFPIEDMFRMLRADNGEHYLTQALLAAPVFQVRWRWNATRALMVPRFQRGKKVPPPLQRFRSDDLLTAVFPAQTACLENRPEDLEIPDHPLVHQSVHDCLHEAMDVHRWLAVLADFEAGRIEFIARDTREPSPFTHELLNSNPYTFLDDAPLEERRTRALATRRSLIGADLDDLGRLDAEAIELVRSQAWPVVRDADELHDALLQLVVATPGEGSVWRQHFELLLADGRATSIVLPSGKRLWTAAEMLPIVQAAYPGAVAEPAIELPEALKRTVTAEEAAKAIVAGRMSCVGPITTSRFAEDLSLDPIAVEGGLLLLEGEGVVLRGRFTPEAYTPGQGAAVVEWCERRLLARIHRLTLDSARRQVQPVEPADYLRFLAAHQHAVDGTRLEGPEGLHEIVAQLEGFESPAGAWEHDLFPARVDEYEPDWLDELSMVGEAAWGRLQPPDAPEEGPAKSNGMTRVVPISIFLRTDLGWLLPPTRSSGAAVRGDAASVLEALEAGGALFFQDLNARAGVLPSQLDDALSELAALGRVSADGFAGIRAIVAPDKRTSFPDRRRRLRRARAAHGASRGGRWSVFPGPIVPVEPKVRIEHWATLLLRRYGVIFRDLLARESVAPPWRDLAAVYRRMEARGEIRGGRFVRGVAGEQFALPGVVETLRQFRDKPSVEEWYISAADPLNLVGILTSGPRVPALRGNALYFRGGVLTASLQAGQFHLHAALEPKLVDDVTRNLARTALIRDHERNAIKATAPLIPAVEKVEAKARLSSPSLFD